MVRGGWHGHRHDLIGDLNASAAKLASWNVVASTSAQKAPVSCQGGHIGAHSSGLSPDRLRGVPNTSPKWRCRFQAHGEQISSRLPLSTRVIIIGDEVGRGHCWTRRPRCLRLLRCFCQICLCFVSQMSMQM